VVSRSRDSSLPACAVTMDFVMAATPPRNDSAVPQQHIPPGNNNARKRKPVPSRIETFSNTLRPYEQGQAFPQSTAASPTPPQGPPSRAPPPPPPAAQTGAPVHVESDQAILLNTASAARWRRREKYPIDSRKSELGELRGRSNSELVLQVKVMEEVHGVDVSWLHHPNKGIHHLTVATLCSH